MNCSEIFKNQKERWPPAPMKLGQCLAQGNANVSRGRPLAVLISMKVTTMLRQYDQEERHTDGSRYWDSITSVLVRKFAHEGARDFDDEKWLQMIFEGSSNKRIEYCKNRDGTRYCLRAIQGRSGGIPINPELMNYASVRYKFWEKGWFQEGRRKIKPVRQSFQHQQIRLEMTWKKRYLMIQSHRKNLM